MGRRSREDLLPLRVAQGLRVKKDANGLRVCECAHPKRHSDPRYPHTCSACSWRISPEWDASDATVRAFFSDLLHAFPTPPPGLEEFIALCLEREAMGRREYGFRYLTRDNASDGYEEAADGAIYGFLEELCAMREGDTQRDMALTVAYKAFDLYVACARLRSKRRGQS